MLHPYGILGPLRFFCYRYVTPSGVKEQVTMFGNIEKKRVVSSKS